MAFKRHPNVKLHIVDCVLQYSRYMYTITHTHDTSLKYYCCDLMATVTSAVTQKSATVKTAGTESILSQMIRRGPFDTLGNGNFFI